MVLVTSWIGISPTYSIHNKSLLYSQQEFTLFLTLNGLSSKAFPLFYLFLHSSCFLGDGPPLTVISLDEFIIHFPTNNNTSPYLPGNTTVTDLPLLLDFISDIWLQGYFIEFTPTQIYFYTWILFFFFYHFLPINIRCHIMILFLLPLLLQSRLHINTISISQPVPNHAYLFKTLHLTHQLLNT